MLTSSTSKLLSFLRIYTRSAPSLCLDEVLLPSVYQPILTGFVFLFPWTLMIVSASTCSAYLACYSSESLSIWRTPTADFVIWGQFTTLAIFSEVPLYKRSLQCPVPKLTSMLCHGGVQIRLVSDFRVVLLGPPSDENENERWSVLANVFVGWSDEMLIINLWF